MSLKLFWAWPLSYPTYYDQVWGQPGAAKIASWCPGLCRPAEWLGTLRGNRKQMVSPVPSLASLWGPSGEKEIGPPPGEEDPVRKSNPHIFHCAVPREKLRKAFRNWRETKEASQITAHKVPFLKGIVFGGQEPPGCQPPVTHSAWRKFQLGLKKLISSRLWSILTFHAAESTVSSARKFSLLGPHVFSYSPFVSQILLVQMEVINPSSLSVGGVLVLRVKNSNKAVSSEREGEKWKEKRDEKLLPLLNAAAFLVFSCSWGAWESIGS